MNTDEKTYREKVYEIVRRIPSGRVMTYGQIAEILGEGYTARTVGFVMHSADTQNVPWQRVVNSGGGCSTAKLTVPHHLQQDLLEQEGIAFKNEKCDLKTCRWTPEEYEESKEQPSLFE